MSPSAWLMLITTWSVVIGVSGYLFWKVVTRPRVENPAGEPGPDQAPASGDPGRRSPASSDEPSSPPSDQP